MNWVKYFSRFSPLFNIVIPHPQRVPFLLGIARPTRDFERNLEVFLDMDTATSQLQPLFVFLAYSLAKVENTFNSIPGSAVVARYVRSSHQNDPNRTLLEVILIIFAIRTLLQSRTPADRSGKHFISFSEKVRTQYTTLRLLTGLIGVDSVFFSFFSLFFL